MLVPGLEERGFSAASQPSDSAEKPPNSEALGSHLNLQLLADQKLKVEM